VKATSLPKANLAKPLPLTAASAEYGEAAAAIGRSVRWVLQHVYPWNQQATGWWAGEASFWERYFVITGLYHQELCGQTHDWELGLEADVGGALRSAWRYRWVDLTSSA